MKDWQIAVGTVIVVGVPLFGGTGWFIWDSQERFDAALAEAARYITVGHTDCWSAGVKILDTDWKQGDWGTHVGLDGRTITLPKDGCITVSNRVLRR